MTRAHHCHQSDAGAPECLRIPRLQDVVATPCQWHRGTGMAVGGRRGHLCPTPGATRTRGMLLFIIQLGSMAIGNVKTPKTSEQIYSTGSERISCCDLVCSHDNTFTYSSLTAEPAIYRGTVLDGENGSNIPGRVRPPQVIFA